jgi:hypothetical protein
VVEGGNRVARHALGAHHQRCLAQATLQLLGGLAEQLEAGATNALRHEGRHLHRHAGIQANVPRQEELIEVPGRHVAGHHRAYVPAGNPRAGQGRTCGLDAQIGGGYVAQRAAVVHHGRAHAVEQENVVEGVEESA